jgi:hypothetical protein
VGLRANLAQFSLLVGVNALVGGMIGQERTVLPLLATDVFGLTAFTATLTFIAAFGIVKAATDFFAGTLSDRYGRKPVLAAGWLVGLPMPLRSLPRRASAGSIESVTQRSSAPENLIDPTERGDRRWKPGRRDSSHRDLTDLVSARPLGTRLANVRAHRPLGARANGERELDEPHRLGIEWTGPINGGPDAAECIRHFRKRVLHGAPLPYFPPWSMDRVEKYEGPISATNQYAAPASP